MPFRPPGVLVAHGLADKDEFYLCLRAVYGLPQSPRDWGITRDQTITDGFCRISWMLSCPHLIRSFGMLLVRSWYWCHRRLILRCGRSGYPMRARMENLDYVDDISTMGPRAFGLAIVNKVKNTWENRLAQEIPDVSQGTAAFFGLAPGRVINFCWVNKATFVISRQGTLISECRVYRCRLVTLTFPSCALKNAIPAHFKS